MTDHIENNDLGFEEPTELTAKDEYNLSELLDVPRPDLGLPMRIADDDHLEAFHIINGKYVKIKSKKPVTQTGKESILTVRKEGNNVQFLLNGRDLGSQSLTSQTDSHTGE